MLPALKTEEGHHKFKNVSIFQKLESAIKGIPTQSPEKSADVSETFMLV